MTFSFFFFFSSTLYIALSSPIRFFFLQTFSSFISFYSLLRGLSSPARFFARHRAPARNQIPAAPAADPPAAVLLYGCTFREPFRGLLYYFSDISLLSSFGLICRVIETRAAREERFASVANDSRGVSGQARSSDTNATLSDGERRTERAATLRQWCDRDGLSVLNYPMYAGHSERGRERERESWEQR